MRPGMRGVNWSDLQTDVAKVEMLVEPNRSKQLTGFCATSQKGFLLLLLFTTEATNLNRKKHILICLNLRVIFTEFSGFHKLRRNSV